MLARLYFNGSFRSIAIQSIARLETGHDTEEVYQLDLANGLTEIIVKEQLQVLERNGIIVLN